MSNAIRNIKRKTERRNHMKSRVRKIMEKPARPLSGMIVYGAGCLWWDVIENANGRTPVPTCPFCGSVLFQFDTEAEFWAGSATYEKTHPGYVALLKWLKGKCFKTMDEAALVYEIATGIHYEVKGIDDTPSANE